MKKLTVTIVCACLALAVMAGVPKPDAARARQALKSESVAGSATVNAGETRQVSFHQFMREHNVNPGDNRLAKKAPSRLPSDVMSGNKIVAVEAQALDCDDDGNFTLNDTLYSMGWKTSVTLEGTYDGFTDYLINGFYGEYSIPFFYDGETPYLTSCVIVDDTIEGSISTQGFLRYRTDRVRYYCLMTLDWFLTYEDYAMPGTVYDDGSIWFDGSYVLYMEDVYNTYRVRSSGVIVSLESSDTTAMISPVFSNIYLLQPNGMHEYSAYSTAPLPDPSTLPLIYQEYLHRVDNVVFVDDNFRPSSGSGTSHPGFVVVVGGGGMSTLGLHPRPIDPRKPTSKSPKTQPVLDNEEQIESGSVAAAPGEADIDRGQIEHRPALGRQLTASQHSAMAKAQAYNYEEGREGDRLYGDQTVPVYMYQLNDTTICVYNLFGMGYTMNYLTITPDGLMNFPPQVLFYDSDLDEDFFNCSEDGDSLLLGCTGVVNNDIIEWDNTKFYSLYSEYNIGCFENKLYFTDGSQFLLGKAETPAITRTQGFASYTFTGVTDEEGAQVCLYTVGCDENGDITEIVQVDNPYEVAIIDVDQVIRLAAVADGSGIGKNRSEMYVEEFLVPGVVMLGDVNRDRLLTVADVTALISHVLNNDFELSSNFNPAAADLNGDGHTTVSDVTMLISMILR